jgi:hypothetical protein
MNILSKFEGCYQLAERDGHFYYVYIHRPELCGYCVKRAERNDPNETNWHADERPQILKELTAESLHVALFADLTETLDFKTYDMRYGVGHTCDEFGWNGCEECKEEFCEANRLERELQAEEERNENAPY